MSEIVLRIRPRDLAGLCFVGALFGGGFAAVSAFTNVQNVANDLPVVLPYQGTLGERVGQMDNEVSGTRDMQFRLFDASTGGALLFESPSQPVRVQDGKFSVVLGAGDFEGTPGNQLEASDLRSSALWLELTMQDPDGPITFARQRIAPAPQTVHAGSSSAAAPGSPLELAVVAAAPPGTIAAFGGATVPDGWLPCDGSARSSADYPALASTLGALWGSDTTTGCQSTTSSCDFELPDLQGEFLRGAGGARGVVGSHQGGATAVPNNAFDIRESGAHEHAIAIRAGIGSDTGGQIANGASAAGSVVTFPTNGSGTHTHTVADGGDPETRPPNYAVTYIIKH
jgi:microcystin-dependent protein